jgi:hypothetical protein
MKRRAFVKDLGMSLAGGAIAFHGFVGITSANSETKPMKKNAILQHPLCPPYLSIDELGWEIFLKQWDREAFEFLKTEILRFGMEGAGKPDSDIEKDKYEQYIHRTETDLNVFLPRELFYGGVAYPPRNLVEEQIAEEKFRAVQEALEKLFAYNSTIYGDPEQQVLIRGTHLFPPASEQEIQSAETHFGVQLPRSYKDFLRVSNGCLLGLNWSLMPIAKIGWTRDLHDQFNKESIVEYIADGQDVPDEVYYQYDDLGITKENFPFYRVKKFLNGLLITDPKRTHQLTDIYPCFPKSPYQDGEWEVFSMNGTRARSFKHMMEYRYLVNIIGWREAAERWKSM